MTPSQQTSPRTRRRISHQQILESAREVVTEHGYGGASVAAIAAHASISHGALYRYFPSKVELFVEVFRDVCDREIRSAGHAARAHADPLDKLDAMLANFALRALAKPQLTWALIAEPVAPAIEAVRFEYRVTYRRGIEKLLRQAVDQGTIPRQDVVVAAAALLGGANEVFAGPLSPLSIAERDPQEAIVALQRLCRGALSSPAKASPRPRGGAAAPAPPPD